MCPAPDSRKKSTRPGKAKAAKKRRGGSRSATKRQALDALLADPAEGIERWAQGDDIPELSPAEWLKVAAAAPARFVWVVDPGAVLPMGDAEVAAQFWTVLRPALAAEDLAITVSWLAEHGMGEDHEAAELLEQRVAAEAEECSWSLLAEALTTLASRGAAWRAARILEEQVEGVGLERDEVAEAERAALAFMDGPLLAALARSPVWRDDEVALGRFASAASTASLIDNFGSTTVPRRLRLSQESGARLQSAVWRILAVRTEPEALATVQALVVSTATQPRTAQLATAMAGLVQQAHGEAALAPMVAAFLSGLHRTPAGEAIERWLMQYPGPCLQEALDPFPDWLPGFDATALRRLCFRILPDLDSHQRAEILDLAEVAGGTRARVVREEFELLPR
jgi:hypothetical protein